MRKLTALFLSLCLLLSIGMTALADTPVIPFSEVDTKENFTIDWSDPLNTLMYGMYAHDLTMGDGSVRQVYQYIPTTWRYAQPSVAVAVPSGKDPIAFFEETGWKEASEKGPFAVLLMTADNWENQDEYVAAAWKFMNDRKNVRTLKVAFYMVGYGDAANQVMEFAVTNNDALCGVAAFGVDSFDNALLEAGKTTQTAVEGVMKSDVPVPMWLGVEKKSAATEELISYWMDVNELSEQKFSNAYADEIYFYPSYLSNTFEKTYMNIQSLYVTEGLEDVYTPAFTDNLYFNWLGRVRRVYSQTLRPLTYYATTEELGMDHYQLTVNDVGREYWVYVPSSVKASGEEAPLVLVAPGGGDSGEEFITITKWFKAAEERGFILAHLMGSRGNQGFTASTTWVPADVDYVLDVREEVMSNYAVDASRIYITGHSMGCQLTMYCTELCPEMFAAACGNDALQTQEELKKNLGDQLGLKHDTLIPFMLNTGSMDQNFIEGRGKDFDQIPEFFGEFCERYGLDYDTQYNFKNGLLYGTEWHNAQGIPLVKFQWNDGKTHCMDSEDPYAIYDFLCNFSRGEDGTSYYMGVEIKLDK